MHARQTFYQLSHIPGLTFGIFSGKEIHGLVSICFLLASTSFSVPPPLQPQEEQAVSFSHLNLQIAFILLPGDNTASRPFPAQACSFRLPPTSGHAFLGTAHQQGSFSSSVVPRCTAIQAQALWRSLTYEAEEISTHRNKQPNTSNEQSPGEGMTGRQPWKRELTCQGAGLNGRQTPAGG